MKDKAWTEKNDSGDLVFFIRIQYRCNASWQGTVQWMDGRQTKSFRSVLELALLLESARSLRKDKQQGNEQGGKWQAQESVS